MADFFPMVTDPIPYEGPDSDNPLAFKWYDAERVVAGKPMHEHLKFAVAYWHTFKGTGADPFGGGVYDRPWNEGADAMDVARKTMDAAFEFTHKLGARYWCFHDRDIAPEGDSIPATGKNLQAIVDQAEQLQKSTGIELLWGTANVFSHPRYTHGAATNPDPVVAAYAASQVRQAIDATVQLGGTGYVFWGGREGYSSLFNTDMKREAEQFARYLHMARDYARKQGFTGTFFIEPKPKEPSSHQYDFDAATVLGFLREYDLLDDFALNIEANHATLAQHTFEHDLMVAHNAGKLGSIDINRGSPTLGWDTDQFPTVLHDSAWTMLILLAQDGLDHGGLNFDAKLRRGSFDLEDLFYAHIGGMDCFAKGLLVADRIRQDGWLSDLVTKRYADWDQGLGQKWRQGEATLEEVADWAAKQGEPAKHSGREELIENIWNEYLFGKGIR